MISELILGYFSREIEQAATGRPEHSLALLQQEYPDLRQLVAGKNVLDFGCGHGEQAALLAAQYDCRVVGLDTNLATIARAKKRHGDVVRFISQVDFPDGGRTERYDVVISQNAMEHFPAPDLVLRQMADLVTDGGKILITFGPPWLSPYGSHMHFFCRIPWLNVIFPEKAVMAVRSRYRKDGARRYEEVESGLNRMTLRKFETLVKMSGLSIERRRYVGVKGMHFLTRLPLLREFFTVHVTVALSRRTAHQA